MHIRDADRLTSKSLKHLLALRKSHDATMILPVKEIFEVIESFVEVCWDFRMSNIRSLTLQSEKLSTGFHTSKLRNVFK